MTISVRNWTLYDLPMVIRLAVPVFQKRDPLIDGEAAERYYAQMFEVGSAAALRTDNAYGLAYACRTPESKQMLLIEQFVFSTRTAPWEVMGIYRAFQMVAGQIGAVRFDFGAKDFDASVIAERLGARPATYSIDIPMTRN